MTPTMLNILQYVPTLCLFSTAKPNTLPIKIQQNWNTTIRHAALPHGCETQKKKKSSFASMDKQTNRNNYTAGSVAEWSKALVLGTSPKGRGFESHRCHIFDSKY